MQRMFSVPFAFRYAAYTSLEPMPDASRLASLTLPEGEAASISFIRATSVSNTSPPLTSFVPSNIMLSSPVSSLM